MEKWGDLSDGIYTIILFNDCRAIQLVNKIIVQNMVRGMYNIKMLNSQQVKCVEKLQKRQTKIQDQRFNMV
jgi:hypothetical protein